MKIRDLDLSESSIAHEHEALSLPPLERQIAEAATHPILKTASYLAIATLISLAIFLLYKLFNGHQTSGFDLIKEAIHNPIFWNAVLVGLIAQAIDGALGMAYGITSSSFLLAYGASPAIATGATHLAEVFTTGISGVSHVKLGNVNKKLFLNLLIPGIIGVILGAYVITNVDGKAIKPYISGYLLIMGLYVLSKAFRQIKLKTDIESAKVAPLAIFGGFMDTAGGGGWGPIVTTSLVGAGHHPRTTIGTVNFAEFFLTVTSAAAFFTLLDGSVWVIVAGLVVGGLFSAPFAAYATRHFKTKTLLILVGLLISCVSIYSLSKLF
ncbi:MAG: sulfite exporter TauE/SafE family protein [Methylotenera sp.]|nr:sulfite exporter TauE/SafE family protein [Methylotenera sp.]